ncbi:MAG: hypothetical protein HOV76_24425, partial [Hamadaea sp.]|nr:hypothetical protein [Hamadaea sp.]
MTLRTFDPGLAYDKATGTGIGSTLAIVTNAVDGTPVDTYDMDGNLAPVITNRDGYFGQFQADADRIRIKIANLTMEATNLEAIVETAAAAQTSADAAVAAQAAAEAAAASATAPANTAIDARISSGASPAIRKTDLAANVKDYGAVGDGVTDDTAAIQACIAANSWVLIPAGTYLVDANVLSINARTGFRLDMQGRFKRKNNSARASTLIVYNSTDVKITRFNSDGNVANNFFGGLPVDEGKHELRIDGSVDVHVGPVDVINPAGDAVYVTGASARVVLGDVTSRSDTISGRNTVSIVSCAGIKVGAVRCYGTGYTTMPGGFDIEPNSGQSVSDVEVESVLANCSSTGGCTVFGNYTVGGVRQINRVKIGPVTIIKGPTTPAGCDVPIKGVNDLHMESVTITQAVGCQSQAFSINDADNLNLYIDAATSRSTVPPTIGFDVAVTNMRLRGRVGQSGSHCLNIYRLDDSEIDMKLRDPGSGVLIVKYPTGGSSNVRWRGDWRKSTGVAVMQINGTVDWQVDADRRDWPSSQLVIGTGAAGVTNKSPQAQSVYSFSTAGQTSWTCPAGAKTIRVIAIGAGGGGGSGRRDAAGTIRFGGGGGGAGSRSDVTLDATAYIGTALTVTVGAGGAGGAAVTTDTTSGAAGGTGGWSGLGTSGLQINTIVNANGGTGGNGGSSTAGAGGVGIAGNVVGSTGGAGSNGASAGGLAVWT